MLYLWELKLRSATIPALLLVALLPARQVLAEKGNRAGSLPLIPSGSSLNEHSSSTTSGKVWSAVGVAGVYAAATTWVFLHYYMKEPNAFKLQSDGWFGSDTYAGGADKLGHFWGNMALTRGTGQVLVAGGWDPLVADVMSVSLAATFYTWSEIQDGYYGWGTSYADLVVNVLGNGFGVLMRRWHWLDDAIDLRVSYFPSRPYRERVAAKGFTGAGEDYTGQTTHLAFHLKALPFIRHEPSLRWLQYLDLTVGYRAVDYEPKGMNPRQEVTFGVALNLQHVLRGVKGPIGGGLRFTAEVFTPPYTYLETVAAERAR